MFLAISPHATLARIDLTLLSQNDSKHNDQDSEKIRSSTFPALGMTSTNPIGMWGGMWGQKANSIKIYNTINLLLEIVAGGRDSNPQ
jgi:hypothetical protein